MDTYKNILLFDGSCNLCNASVRFVRKRDKAKIFNCISLESSNAEKLLSRFNTSLENNNSIIYIKDDRIYFKSAAVLHILKDLKRGWQFFYVFVILPRFLRDFIYDIVARYRYAIFGRNNNNNSC